MSSQDEPLVETSLSAREAFLVMSDFLWEYARSAGDDLITLLGDISLEGDGQPTDAAAWEDWISSIRRVKRMAGPS